jgi:hypothetical protein
MSQKARDERGRWRNKTVAFRMSEEENRILDTKVSLSGLTKQDYIIRQLLGWRIEVQANPRVYKALRNQMKEILEQLLQDYCRRDNRSGSGGNDLACGGYIE